MMGRGSHHGQVAITVMSLDLNPLSRHPALLAALHGPARPGSPSRLPPRGRRTEGKGRPCRWRPEGVGLVVPPDR